MMIAVRLFLWGGSMQIDDVGLEAWLVKTIKPLCSDVTLFCARASYLPLRQYQLEVAQAIVDSVFHRRGHSFVVMFPRQSGKNELQAQIEAYLLALYSEPGAEIVKVSPTWKPQSLNAMRRLQRVLERNLVCSVMWVKESGYIYRLNQARMFFFSGAPEANIVGATASTLLEVDEAQDVSSDKYDKEIAPMAASTNATRVFWGTAWTAQTLLARELRAARAAEAQDGVRRAFVIDAGVVAAEVPAYGSYVAEQVARLGRRHPMVRTQYYSEEIDGESGMFTPERRALMQGDHIRRSTPEPGKLYALLVDVAGEDPGADTAGRTLDAVAALANPGRDATAVTIMEVDTSSLADEALRAPTYCVVDRRVWVGARQTAQFAQIKALAEAWHARKVIVDATGVGAGLASFLEKALPGRVLPFIFNSASKSQLGWDLLTLIETGRFKDWRDPGDGRRDERWEFWRQVEACQWQVSPGPEQRVRWGVPDGTRDPLSGELLHDDLLISAALCAVLDEQDWPAPGLGTLVVRRGDVLKTIDREGY
jgi:hypothetical protein